MRALLTKTMSFVDLWAPLDGWRQKGPSARSGRPPNRDRRNGTGGSAALAVAALAFSGLGLSASAGCGSSPDVYPAMPDPTVVDRSADDMGMPEAAPAPEGSSGGEDTEGAEEDPEPPRSPVQVVAGARTPIEGASPTLRILAPRNGTRITRGNAMLRIRLANWQLEQEPGRHVHVIVDNEPYIAVRDVSAPLDLNALVQEHLGHELTEGTHVVRVFPSRGHHESVKTDGAFATVVFHYRTETEGFAFDADAPLLTYSRPKGCNPAGERVLLDFYLSNAELAADGTRVRYDIDGDVSGDIATWAPHYIENLPVGSHTILLTLIGADGEPVPGQFNDTTRTIQVAQSCQ